MHHITPERIAALADEPATLPERTHLAECMDCTTELVVAQRLMRMAMTDTPAIERPITSWERLGPALRAEGLVRAYDGEDVVAIGAARRHRYRWAMQAAAGVLLAVSGAVVGRASVAMPEELAARDRETAVVNSDTGFRSTAEAMSALQVASGQYQRAVEYLAVNDSGVTLSGRDAADLYLARLGALDQAVAATRAALFRAPRDPVLNQYYLSTLGARDLTLRQIGGATPVSSSKRTRF